MTNDRAPRPEVSEDPAETSYDDTLVGCIWQLLAQEPFAVLCTQGGGQPYGSVVAFAFADDLSALCFATPVATRKYRLLSECDRVALVIDNRDKFPGAIIETSALTVTGRAGQIESGPDLEQWARALTKRHPFLNEFVKAPSTALFAVRAERYLYVTRFQEVRQWAPAGGG